MRSSTTAKRAEGTLALADVDSPESVESLIEALGDPDTDVRVAAGLGLASLRDPASIAALAASSRAGAARSWRAPAGRHCAR
jgi:HEAT repeat protein